MMVNTDGRSSWLLITGRFDPRQRCVLVSVQLKIECHSNRRTGSSRGKCYIMEEKYPHGDKIKEKIHGVNLHLVYIALSTTKFNLSRINIYSDTVPHLIIGLQNS